MYDDCYSEKYYSIINSDLNSDVDVVSLDMISNVFLNERNKYERELRELERRLENNNNFRVNIDFTYGRSRGPYYYDSLIVRYSYNDFRRSESILFRREEDRIYRHSLFDILDFCNWRDNFDIVKELFFLYDKYEYMFSTSVDTITTDNNYKVNINPTFVEIYDKTHGISIYNENGYVKFICDDENLEKYLKMNYRLIFKNIFIKIDDCPLWMRDILREKRNKELGSKPFVRNLKRFMQ